MAQGDVSQFGPTSTANNAFLSCQPTGTEQVVINNAYYAGAVQFEYWDGTNLISFDSDTAAGARYNQNWRCTNTKYVRIKNVSGSTMFIAADGFVTRA